MSDAIQLALILGPVAIYLYVLGIWQSGRRPRVISGRLDYALLVFGLSGLILFGPAGRVVQRFLFGEFNAMTGTLWAGFVGLWAIFLAGKASRRVVIYHVDEAAFLQVVESAVKQLDGAFSKTLNGYEDSAGGRSILVQANRILTVGVVEIDGKDSENLAKSLRALLRQTTLEVDAKGATKVTWGLFLLSWISMVAPMLSLLLNEAHMSSLVRQFFQRIQGGP